MCDSKHDQQETEGTSSAGIDSAWIRRHLADSIYLWACGQKADDEDEDPKLSDRLIGWLILLMQGFAYTMLIVLARATADCDTIRSAEDSRESGYLLPSVTGAMYLLVASTSHDLGAGFSLLVDGPCAGHRAFGASVLIVYGIMIGAAMTVLVSTSDDSASVVLNAVILLFIADLDENALKFLSSVPQRWRLFWAIYSVGISFALAVVAINYFDDSSALWEGNNGVPQTWFIWMLNLLGVTLTSVLLSSTLQAVCRFLVESCEGLGEPRLDATVKGVFIRLVCLMKSAKERFRGNPCLYVIKPVWLAQMVPNWLYMQGGGGLPVVFGHVPVYSPRRESGGLNNFENKLIVILLIGVLAIGLALKALRAYFKRNERLSASRLAISSSDEDVPKRVWRTCIDSCVPSLLVGWGVGFWVTSLLSMLVCAWHRSACGWHNPPIVVTINGYVIVPCFLFAGVFMVTDTNFMGKRFGAFIEPAVRVLRN